MKTLFFPWGSLIHAPVDHLSDHSSREPVLMTADIQTFFHT